jgi:asparagine synthase (glutamine-hydrolysing)
MARDLLTRETIERRGIFDPAAVERLKAANDTGLLDASYTLFAIMCIEAWASKFVDRPESAGQNRAIETPDQRASLM